MKKNIFKKLGGLFLGLAMGLGVAIGVTAGNKASEVDAAGGTATYKCSSKTAASLASGTAPTGASIEYKNSGSNGNDQMTSGTTETWTIKGYSGLKITKIEADLKRNSKNGGGSVVITDNGTQKANLSYPKANLTSNYTFYTLYSTEYTCGGNIVITLTSSENSFWCDQVRVTWEESTPLATLVSLSSLNAEVSATAGDTRWTISSPVVTGVLSDSTSVVDVSDYVDISVTEAVPTIKEDGTTTVTLVATGKSDPKITISAPVTATLSTFNPLKDLYSKSASYSCDVYGIFVGNKDNNNIVIMYGEYGMDIYKSGCGSNSYVAGETILHVSGPLDIFNGLYEIKATSISTSTTESVPTPVVYVTQGGETSLYQSRLTNISGVPTVTKGSITGTAGSADVTLNFKVGTKDVQVFYKKANQTADGMSKMSAAVTNQEVITVTGFTSWYNGFQIQMTDIVEADASYTAEAFAQDLLSETDAVCAGYNGVTDNYSALLTVWNTLIDADHYQKVPQDQKNILVTTVANTSGTDVQKAMARYDYLVGKYGLSPFIDGRTPSPARVLGYINNQNDNTATIIIAVVSVLSLTTLCTLTVIKRRKSIEK